MQLCFPHMRDQGGGSIINMGSSYGIRCEPGFLAYAASKEAIRTLTRTGAKEWGKYKIRVNTILPSAMSPKALWYLEESKSYDLELSKVALGVFGSPEDIAPSAIFLASDESNYVTGQTLGISWEAGLEVVAPLEAPTEFNQWLRDWLDARGEGVISVVFGVRDLDRHKARLAALGIEVGPLMDDHPDSPWHEQLVLWERQAGMVMNTNFTLGDIDYADGVIPFGEA